MRILKAFVTAVVLFAISIVSFRFYVNSAIISNTNDIDYYMNRNKFLSTAVIANNLDKHTALVLGSSELSKLDNTSLHPKQLINALDKSFMLVGEGYFQSLNHAIRMGAIANKMENKKVNLILSPQWFTAQGTNPAAFASRFSEDNYIAFLKNPKISKKTKQAIIQRSSALLHESPKMAERMHRYEKVYTQKDASLLEDAYTSIFSAFISLKTDVAFLRDYQHADAIHLARKPKAKFSGFDEAHMLAIADRLGAKEVTNSFNMEDKSFHKRYEGRIERKKDSQSKESYSESPEYKDLQLFLDVCKENQIKVNLIMIPVNGFWYDHIGFTKDKRQAYYTKITMIAQLNEVQLSDLSANEYTQYFFIDATHYGWKGWVYVNESILKFESER